MARNLINSSSKAFSLVRRLVAPEAILKYLLLSACLFWSGVGHAAQSRFLEEVIVTAEKVKKSAQDTPIAITAIDEQFIEDTGIADIDDLSIFIPSFSRTVLDLSIRGVGRAFRDPSGDVGVGVYQNGIYSEEAVFFGSEMRYYDLERVEVLRGPQGTLYGRNAVGGVVNYVFNPPSQNFFAEIQSGGGAHNAFELLGVLNGPLIKDVLAARLVAAHTYNGADRHSKAAPAHVALSDTGRSEDSTVSLALDFTPTDTLSLSLRFVDRYQNGTPRAPLYIGEGLGDRRTRSSAVCLPVGTDCFNESATTSSGTGHTGSVLNPNAHQQLPVSGDGYGNDLENVAYPDVKPLYVVKHNSFFVDGQWHLNYGNFTLRYLGGYHDATADALVEGYSNQPGPGGRNTCLPPRCEAGLGGVLVSAAGLTASNPVRQESHELQIISNLEGRFNFVAGINYTDVERELDITSRNPAHLGTYTVNPTYGVTGIEAFIPRSPGPGRHDVSVNELNAEVGLFSGTENGEWFWLNSENRTRSAALYGQLGIELHDEWQLSLGARWTRDEKSGYARSWLFFEPIDFDLVGFNQAITTDPVTGGPNGDPLRFAGLPLVIRSGLEIEDEWEELTWHINLSWRPHRRLLGFASITTGHRPGGFNLIFDQPSSYDKEQVTSYEVGFKSDLIEDRLRVSGNVYYYDYQNHQVQSTSPVSSSIYTCSDANCPDEPFSFNLFSAVNTIPEAVNWGTELEVIWAPLPDLTIGVMHSYINTEVTSDYFVSKLNNDWSLDESDELLNVKGAKLNRAPEHKVSLWANYTWPMGDRGVIDFLASYSYMGEQNNNIIDHKVNRSPAYERWDARATWDSPTGKYRFAAFVKNITNELGIIEMRTGANFGRFVETTPPRSWGVEFRMRFGEWNRRGTDAMMAPERGH